MVLCFLIWCADGMIPLARALREPGGEEEERRLFYVAVTRARDQLYLCSPMLDYTRSAGTLTLSPSRFISEIAPLSAQDNSVRLNSGRCSMSIKPRFSIR